jgi:hypothetical protein
LIVAEDKERADGRLKLKIPYAEYQQICNLLVLRMRQVEEEAERECPTFFLSNPTT